MLQQKQGVKWQALLDQLVVRLSLELPDEQAEDVQGDGACYFRAEYLKLVELSLRNPVTTKRALSIAAATERAALHRFMTDHADDFKLAGSSLRYCMALAMKPDVDDPSSLNNTSAAAKPG